MLKIKYLLLLLLSLLMAVDVTAQTSLDQFNEITKDVLKIYESSLNKKIVVSKNWSDDSLKVTPLDMGTHFSLYIAGGIFRLKSITPDAFALILCHEIGHFAGGAPTYGEKALSPEEGDLSAEGQADYWASAKCFRKVFADKDNLSFMKDFKKQKANSFVFKEMLPIINKKCSEVWLPSLKRVAQCERTIVAARSFARTVRIKSNEKYWVNITTPSPIIAPYTNLFHPPAQCRFDTYVAGALCEIPSSEDVSFENMDDGVCSRSKGYEISARPLCWYKPK